MCAAFAVCRGFEEVAGLELWIVVGIGLTIHHASGDAVCLQMRHGGAGVLRARPGGQAVIEFVLMLQTASQ